MPAYAAMIIFVSPAGTSLVAQRITQILFGRSILSDPARKPLTAKWHAVIDFLPKSIVRSPAASTARGSVLQEVSGITARPPIIASEEFHPIALHHQQAVATAIAGAGIEVVSGVGPQ